MPPLEQDERGFPLFQEVFFQKNFYVCNLICIFVLPNNVCNKEIKLFFLIL